MWFLSRGLPHLKLPLAHPTSFRLALLAIVIISFLLSFRKNGRLIRLFALHFSPAKYCHTSLWKYQRL